jgi:hypothetical protein
MKANDSKNWMNEYSEFLDSDTVRVPPELGQKVLNRIHELLRPSAWSVFAKLLGIHIVVGFLSLSICHQFEMNPFGTKSSLSDWFMSMWGHSTCMILCGGLFLSATVFCAGYLLTMEEVRALKQTEFIQTLALGGVSLALFAVFGAELAMTFAGLWLLGALVGGFVATEAVFRLKLA